MKNRLEVTLKKCYRKEGNRIVFQNGMDLNQFALTMWENLGYKGIDPSVISRVINGKRLFTPSQLRVFCQILNLSQHQRNILFSALYNDLLYRFGADNSIPKYLVINNFGQKLNFENPIINSSLNQLTKKSLTLFKQLISQLVPQENSLALIQIPFSQKSYFLLLDHVLHHRYQLLDRHFAGFEVLLPICSFSQTVIGLDNNCRCGYHLSLYGVISRALSLKITSHNLIQQEINRWINYFFPLNAVIKYIKKSQDYPSYHQLSKELGVSQL